MKKEAYLKLMNMHKLADWTINTAKSWAKQTYPSIEAAIKEEPSYKFQDPIKGIGKGGTPVADLSNRLSYETQSLLASYIGKLRASPQKYLKEGFKEAYSSPANWLRFLIKGK